jgi:hypothetical protein
MQYLLDDWDTSDMPNFIYTQTVRIAIFFFRTNCTKNVYIKTFHLINPLQTYDTVLNFIIVCFLFRLELFTQKICWCDVHIYFSRFSIRCWTSIWLSFIYNDYTCTMYVVSHCTLYVCEIIISTLQTDKSKFEDKMLKT